MALLILGAFIAGYGVSHFHFDTYVASGALVRRVLDELNTLNTQAVSSPLWLSLAIASLTLIGSFFGTFSAWLRLRLKIWIAPEPIDLYFRSQPLVPIILPRTDNVVFRPLGEDGQERALPSNAPLVALGDALAISIIESYVERTYRGKKKVVFHYATNGAVIRNSENFIVIGGPAVNEATRRLLKPLKTAFSVEVDPANHDWFLRTGNGGPSFRAERDGITPHAEVRVDYGAAVCIKIHHAERQRVAMLFGLNPFGTTAAAEAFVGKSKPRKILRRLARLISRNDDAVLIVQTQNEDIAGFKSSLKLVTSIGLQERGAKPAP